VIDAGGCAVLPGFIDAHTHLVFGGNRIKDFEQRIAGRTYQEIAASDVGIASTLEDTRKASEEELLGLRNVMRNGFSVAARLQSRQVRVGADGELRIEDPAHPALPAEADPAPEVTISWLGSSLRPSGPPAKRVALCCALSRENGRRTAALPMRSLMTMLTMSVPGLSSNAKSE
jgi:imidazolonepropionase